MLAADTLSTRNGNREGVGIKILKRGRLMAGASGSSDHAKVFRDWFIGGCIGPSPYMGENDKTWAEGFIIMPDGLVVVFGPQTKWVNRPYTGFAAWGSGGDVALGAMAAGASAEEAVRAACLLDIHTGGEITVLTR